jgi:sulfhydrogenase subunit alpha
MPKLTVDHVARIEGHGDIAVSVADGVVTQVRLDVVEPARFFESMVVGRRFDEAPLITSRICGICSPNHQITSIKAVEAAMGVEATERTTLLRKLLVYGSYLQNHATHLYLFAAPDYCGVGSVLPLARTHPDVVRRALRIKKLGNDLTALVGGRPVHPVTAVVGGFTREPDAKRLEYMRPRLHEAAEDARETVALFRAFEYPEFETAGEMLALVADGEYAIYDGAIGALDAGWRRPVADYRDILDEAVVTHSNAKHSTVGGRTFFVGSLARVSLSAALLTPMAARAASIAGIAPPSRNPFHNNLAQAVELIDAAERCAGYIESLLDDGGTSEPVAFDVRAGEGSSATEAPRGTLYHSYRIDENGIVTMGNVVTPTAQNLGNLDADMRAFAPTVVDRPEPEFRLLLEELVRSYDPCLSCSVH